ncbi:tetratricopeptide repeat domain-containing protein [Chloropicon primus]|nr:tetratricopeptide repeat domain-containing protein [Chloropicon primus]
MAPFEEEEEFVPSIVEVVEEEGKSLEVAEGLKKEGNDLFKSEQYEKSLEKYASALLACPSTCQVERSVYHCNSAACHVKRGDFLEGKEECDKALDLNETYVKALMRRIACLEKLDEKEQEKGDASFGFSGDGPREERGSEAPAAEGTAVAPAERASPKKANYLELALEDCKKWEELEPRNREASGKRSELEKKMKDRQEALKEEVMGKLKDLGNNILGRFGLSLDNFKAEKDPNTGSYSINFKK